MTTSQYKTGYSVGVGAVVYQDDRVLFVRSVRKDGGHWQLPGGFVERNELLDAAIQREVQEEAGIDCALQGIVAVRNCLYEAEEGAAEENSLYVAFKLTPLDPTVSPRPDGVETDAAQFMSMSEIDALTPCPAIFKTLAKTVIAEQNGLLRPSKAAAEASRRPYMLCL